MIIGAYPGNAYLVIGDSTSPAAGYQSTLTPLLGDGWWEKPNRIAIAGGAVSDIKTYVDANLAAIPAWPAPTHIFINLGKNDVKALPAEATLKANYLAICDALYAKWPDARQYIMRIWRGTLATIEDINTFDGWCDDIIAARDCIYTGPDERIFIENGDDGATYTLDGTHPNAAGYALTAQQWYSVLA